MRIPRFRPRTLAVAAVVAAACVWLSWRHPYESIRGAGGIVVYEGLPHPMYEEQAFAEELKAKPTIRLAGSPFYREPLDVKPEDLLTLITLLGDGGTYESYTGEKRCGGFHPDYAVQWRSVAGTARALIGFGCSEVLIEDPGGGLHRYDLRVEGATQRSKLMETLKAYRRERPPHERFGLFPVDAPPGP